MTANNDKKESPLILAVETSGRMGSVAIARGPQLLAEENFSAPMRHSAELFPAIQKMLRQSDLEASQIGHIYFSIGPGSFTGLRIAAALAKTFALANNARIVAVNTLDVIAANVIPLPPQNSPVLSGPATERIATVLDAKRGQFFIALYDKTNDGRTAPHTAIWQKVLPDCLMTADEFVSRFANTTRQVWLLGEGLVYYRDKFAAQQFHFFDEKFWYPSARTVHLLGRQLAQTNCFADPIALTPFYLRQPDVKYKAEQNAQR